MLLGVKSLAKAAAAALLLLACAVAAAAQPREAMIVAADARAVEAGEAVLREGGSAADAAIAAMLVLGLVEPQSAGLGGGGFLLSYDSQTHAVDAYDGRENAPRAATPSLFLDAEGRALRFPDAAASGLSTGAPGLIPMLFMAHRRHGRLPWSRLAAPAIQLAEEGFIVSPRLAGLLRAAPGALRENPAAAAYFFLPTGEPVPAGHRLRNPAYAETLRAIVARREAGITRGPVAAAIVAAVRRGPRPGALSLTDLSDYRPRRLAALCGTFRAYRVCGMPPPSSGGQATLAILGLYDRVMPAPGAANDPRAWSAFLWASRLAYADRGHYLADDRQRPVPFRALIAPAYLDARARQIDLSRAAPADVAPGDPSTILGGPSYLGRWGRELPRERPGTTHLSVVDAEGDAVALTASIEGPFGSQRMAAGFLLNNQLTDFSLSPTLNGLPVANAPGPGRRPRSSMSPTIVLDAEGRLAMVAGSPGGGGIIAYVARVLIGVLDWGQSPAEAVAGGNIVAPGPVIRFEEGRTPPALQTALTAQGWRMAPSQSEVSGLNVIRASPSGLEGAADPRREGRVGRIAPDQLESRAR